MTERVWCERKEVLELLGVDKDRYYDLAKAGLLTLRSFPTYRRKKVVARAEVLRLRESLGTG